MNKIMASPNLNIRMRPQDWEQVQKIVELLADARPDERVDVTSAIRYSIWAVAEKLKREAAQVGAEGNGR